MYYQHMDDLGALGLGAEQDTSFGPEQWATVQKSLEQAGKTYRDLAVAKAVAQQRPPTQYLTAGAGFGPGVLPQNQEPMSAQTKWLLGIGAVLLVGAGVLWYTKRKKSAPQAASNPCDDNPDDDNPDDDGGGWKTIGA